jgi:hypothetical protein
MVRVLTLTALVCAVFAVSAASASAATSMESIFQDDSVLLNSGAESTSAGLDEMGNLGVTTIHSLVVWAQVAPDRQSTKRPKGFVGTDPADYADANWEKYDRLVREATARGFSIILTVTTPGPAWAGDCTTTTQRQVCVINPKVKEFSRFIKAVATRYSGTYTPEGQTTPLPKVSRWSFVNEPNLGAWLQPQYETIKGSKVASGARIYRDLYVSATKTLRKVKGHSGDRVYLGETAPVGGSGSSLSAGKNGPRSFLRTVLCLRDNGTKMTDSRVGCTKDFKTIDASGVAHHPYTLGAGAPPFARTGADDITIGFLSRLTSILSQAGKQKRLSKTAAGSVYFTEFGYQTNPPDDNFGVSWAKQAEYINQADYISYTLKQVKGVSQYELYDDIAKASFNTGLYTCRFSDSCGTTRKKPAYAAYRLPLYVVAAPTKTNSSRIRVFGWARPARGKTSVEIHLVTGSGSKRRDKVIRTVSTSSNGTFSLYTKRQNGEYQLRWSNGTNEFLGRAARVALR